MAENKPDKAIKENKPQNVPLPMGNGQNEANTMPQGINPMTMQMAADEEKRALAERQRRKMAESSAKPKIGTNEIMKASEILRKYKEGKARLEQKIIRNEEFWKLRQWNYMNDGKADFKPASAWLWSCIQGRYSDAMDSYPTCNFRPRQMDDKQEALKLSSIVPVILEQNRYEDVYSDIVWYALKHGGAVQGVFWDGSKHNGLGDISIKKIDVLNIFWQPGITDIQASENIFTTELVSNRLIEQRYPQTVGKLGTNVITLAKYLYDDNVDTTDKSVVVDWYYKTEYNGKHQVHYVKFVGDVVLYATENEISRPESVQMDKYTGIPVYKETGLSLAETGLYEHGLYPFVTMALYPIEGSIIGYGLTDIGRDTQLAIDKLDKAIVDNAVAGSKPRFFIRNDGAINEKEYADLSNDFIHTEGNLGDENIRPVDTCNLDSIYVNVLQSKVDELKFITSNQDVNNGSTPSGITAASAIAALQESAGKNARSSNKTFYRAFREVCYQVIELIRQFYDIPRTFRIVPDSLGEQFVQYDNSNLKGQTMQAAGIDMGLRLPEFDIDISAEKNNPYKKMEINELALSFYNAGFFNPQMCDQALSCLDMMDFSEKDSVMQRIRANGTIYEQMLRYQQLALTLAQKYDPMMAEQIGSLIMGDASGEQMGLANTDLDGSEDEQWQVARAKETARESTQVE